MREFLIIFFIIELLAIGVIYNYRKNLISPAPIYSTIFLLMMIFSLIFGDTVYSEVKYGYDGYLWIQLSIIAVIVGQLLASFVSIKKTKKPITSRFNIRPSNLRIYLIIVGIVLLAIAVFNYISSGGISNTSQYAEEYYASGGVSNSSFIRSVLDQILSVITLITSFLAGMYLFFKKKISQKIIAFFPMLYQVINMLYSSQKLGIILTGILMIIGYCICSLYANKPVNGKVMCKIIGRYWIAIPILITLFVISFMLRFGVFSGYYFSESVDKLGLYAFGSPHAFNYWYITDGQAEYTFGLNTFMGIPHTLGLIEREAGVYLTGVYTTFGKTNVYMSFRGLIEDFGKYGSLVFLMIFGFVSGYSYNCFLKNKSYGSLFVLGMSYLFILYSFIISPFIYLNLSVFFIIFIFAKIIIDKVPLNERSKRKRRKKVLKRYSTIERRIY